MKSTIEVVHLFPGSDHRVDEVIKINIPNYPRVESIEDPVMVRLKLTPQIGYEGVMSRREIANALRVVDSFGIRIGEQIPEMTEGWNSEIMAASWAVTGAEKASGLLVAVRAKT